MVMKSWLALSLTFFGSFFRRGAAVKVLTYKFNIAMIVNILFEITLRDRKHVGAS